ncbi:MAG: S-layer homology domain-containing protein [Oscillospiraceae bacterium]|nr:S-layer homology domain-containing protein [Oscillospiraceae bacterium]
MKKRVISFLMVVVLLTSLVPMGAFAAYGDISIVSQPKDVSVDLGGTATFTIETSSPYGADLKYCWVDIDQINTDNIISFSSFIKEAEKVALGTEKTLVMKNVTEDMDGMTIRCAAYYTEPGILDIPKVRCFILSNTATLNVRPPVCDEKHTLTKTEAADPTCARVGNIEYYYCTVCERYYIDEACTQETTLDECTIPKLTTHDKIVLVEAKAETCCEKGCIEHWVCKTCGQAFADETGTVKLDNSDVEIPIDAAKHTNLVHHDAVAATCCEQGTKEYWYCDGCDKYFTDADGKKSVSKSELDVDKDKTNHSDLVYYPPNEPTCTKEGNKSYYYCSGCKNYYNNSSGTDEAKKSEITREKLGHDYEWVVIEDSDEHAQKCSRCGDQKNQGSHTGGEAYCAGKAVCDTCGFEYGTVDPDNHIHTEKQITVEPTLEKDGLCNIYCTDCEKIVAENVKISYADICEHELVKVEEVPAKCEDKTDAEGVKEHYKCSKCGTLFNDADGKNRIDDPAALTIEPLKHYIIDISGAQVPNPKVLGWDYDEIGHWQACKFCGLRYSTYNTHTYLGIEKPTCCTGNVCMTCGYNDGKVDPENHSGGTEIVGAVEPVGDEPGYTGDTKCLGCGEIIEKGRTYYAACPDGCAATLEFVPAVEKTCTEDGVKAHYVCTVCGNMYLKSDGTQPTDDAGIVDPCTGHDLHPGKDALTSVDFASLMASLDISTDDLINMIKNGDFSSLKDITYESLLANLSVKDIDHCYDDTYHWLGCQRCGKTLEDLRPELEKNGITINERWYELSRKTAHSGGVADCKNKAICDECGEAYGDFGKHRYDAVVTPPTCTEKGYTTHTCSGCNDSYVDSYTPAAGHKINKGRCENCKQNFPNPFVDVESGSVYYEHVLWAYYYDPQITAGTDATHFSPSAPCTRGQVVTFLWRAAGRPQPTSTSISFSDVMNSGACQPYYTAILWAAENGITTGYSDGTFRPHAQVKRAEFVTFLWRYYGQPSPSSLDNPFVDVSPSSVFYKAILWAAEEGITQGYGNNDFQPNRICSRWQVVTFLHRAIS